VGWDIEEGEKLRCFVPTFSLVALRGNSRAGPWLARKREVSGVSGSCDREMCVGEALEADSLS